MKNNRSVLVLTTSFPIYNGITVGNHVFEKCQHLYRKGWKVKVLAPSHYRCSKQEKIDGIEIYRFSYFWPEKYQKLAYGAGIPTNIKSSIVAKLQIPFFLLSFLLNAFIQTKKVDVIHCHWSLAGFVGVIAGKLLRKKTVLMMHGAEVFVLGAHPFLKFVLKHCDFLLCNSSFTEKKTLAVYPVKNYKVIPPGVSLRRFYPQSKIKNLRKKLNIPEKSIFILCIGKFIPRKGIEYLIEAMDLIINKNKNNNIYLRIGGLGPLKDKYQRLIHKYNLEKFIEFTGYITDDDIPSYYTEADIFILPSIVDENGDTEGLGLVFLEANACGTPVISSRVGGIKDVIVNGKNGLFAEQKNAMDITKKILKLINEPKLREKMGRYGREYVKKKFNWNKIADEIIGIYKKIL